MAQVVEVLAQQAVMEEELLVATESHHPLLEVLSLVLAVAEVVVMIVMVLVVLVVVEMESRVENQQDMELMPLVVAVVDQSLIRLQEEVAQVSLF
tara:strand:- start:39 stop:323 length:285 start_codon:yes stop_codon:yes gene_type:complete